MKFYTLLFFFFLQNKKARVEIQEAGAAPKRRGTRPKKEPVSTMTYNHVQSRTIAYNLRTMVKENTYNRFNHTFPLQKVILPIDDEDYEPQPYEEDEEEDDDEDYVPEEWEEEEEEEEPEEEEETVEVTIGQVEEVKVEVST